MAVMGLDRHIEITAGVVGGRARIAGRRITVQDIAIWHRHLGKSVDEICADHDLSLAEVHAVLSYYFDNQAEIDSRIAESQSFVEQLRQSTPSVLEKKMRERRGG